MEIAVSKVHFLNNNIESLNHNVTFTFMTISPLFVYRCVRSLRFFQKEFDKEAISNGKNDHYRWGIKNVKWFYRVFS